MLRRIGRPSPALVIACISLFIALGGVGYAAATGSIDGREIKNNSVASKDVKNSSIVGKDVKNNSLTGSDISESKLGKVPLATSADTASAANTANTANTAGSAGSVGGLRFKDIAYAATSGSPARPFFSDSGLTLTGSCGLANQINVVATTSRNDTSIRADGNVSTADNSLGDDVDNFDITDTLDVDDAIGDNNANPSSGTLYWYDGSTGRHITIHLYENEDNPGCRVFGYAVIG